jgi:hypothetical protein
VKIFTFLFFRLICFFVFFQFGCFWTTPPPAAAVSLPPFTEIVTRMPESTLTRVTSTYGSLDLPSEDAADDAEETFVGTATVSIGGCLDLAGKKKKKKKKKKKLT